MIANLRRLSVVDYRWAKSCQFSNIRDSIGHGANQASSRGSGGTGTNNKTSLNASMASVPSVKPQPLQHVHKQIHQPQPVPATKPLQPLKPISAVLASISAPQSASKVAGPGPMRPPVSPKVAPRTIPSTASAPSAPTVPSTAPSAGPNWAQLQKSTWDVQPVGASKSQSPSPKAPIVPKPLISLGLTAPRPPTTPITAPRAPRSPIPAGPGMSPLPMAPGPGRAPIAAPHNATAPLPPLPKLPPAPPAAVKPGAAPVLVSVKQNLHVSGPGPLTLPKAPTAAGLAEHQPVIPAVQGPGIRKNSFLSDLMKSSIAAKSSAPVPVTASTASIPSPLAANYAARKASSEAMASSEPAWAAAARTITPDSVPAFAPAPIAAPRPQAPKVVPVSNPAPVREFGGPVAVPHRGISNPTPAPPRNPVKSIINDWNHGHTTRKGGMETTDGLTPAQLKERLLAHRASVPVADRTWIADEGWTAAKTKKSQPTVIKEVVIPAEGLTIREAASRMAMKIPDVEAKLIALGELDPETQRTSKDKKPRQKRVWKAKGQPKLKSAAEEAEEIHLDADVVELLVLELGFQSKRLVVVDNEVKRPQDFTDLPLSPRPPMVTIMGHVDHGKTTLLDSLRRIGSGKEINKPVNKTKKGAKPVGATDDIVSIADGEVGGITQKLSAFSVPLGGGEGLVIVDTPGHAAFSTMRSMGASFTDVAIIIVSMDDGIQPQTMECIKLAQTHNIPIIIAVNKVDRYTMAERVAAITRINNTLSQQDVLTSDYGGNVPIVSISAKTGFNLDALLSTVRGLCSAPGVSEEDEGSSNSVGVLAKKLSVPHSGPAEGIILDTRFEKGRGVVAKIIITWGALSVGDDVVIGTTHGRVKSLIAEDGKNIKSAVPGQIVRLLGLRELPPLATELITVEDEATAKSICERRGRLATLRQQRTVEAQVEGSESEEDMMPLHVILKADSQGSLEALKFIVDAVTKAAKVHGVNVKVIHAQVGEVTSQDVDLASTAPSNCLLAFNVDMGSQQTRALAKQSDVMCHTNDIIYRLEEELVKKVEEMLPQDEVIVKEGTAKLSKVFSINDRTVAGLTVTSGTLFPNSLKNKSQTYKYQIIRDGVPLELRNNGVLAVELKHFKDNVKSVPSGQDCGMYISNHSDYLDGDIVECYKLDYVGKKLVLGYAASQQQKHGKP